jgi:uroporphyrin-III C-methyltransferase/precorrin-2 dehydrogenase/sirohydrochlorin ferrochelatase
MQAIARGRAPAPEGRIARVATGPGARDQLTLRAAQRLQEADVIFCPRDLDAAIHDLARRDAVRAVLPDDPVRAAAEIRAAFAPGACVVVLASEHGAAAAAMLGAAGLVFEHVPGIGGREAAPALRPAEPGRDLPAKRALHA